jgi:hypothetical protein
MRKEMTMLGGVVGYTHESRVPRQVLKRANCDAL